MNLEDTLYNIATYDSSAMKWTLKLNPDADIFIGHFPGNPITPGVVMLQIARELLSGFLNKPLALRKAVNIKYTEVLSPLSDPMVDFTFSSLVEEENTIKCKVAIAGEGKTFARISLVYDKL